LKILKTKWYPVDFDEKLIYDDPQPREVECSFGRYYHGRGTIGVPGKRLIKFEQRYKTFQIKSALTEPSPSYLEWAAKGFQASAETTLPREIAPYGRLMVALQPGQQIDAEWLAAMMQCSTQDAELQLIQGVARGQLREICEGKYELI
jgi:hypothetical protein